jgi:DNA-binding NtrC family response regulator
MFRRQRSWESRLDRKAGMWRTIAAADGRRTLANQMLIHRQMASSNRCQPRSILVVDDEEGFSYVLKAVLGYEGYVVHVATSAYAAIKLYEERCRDIGLVLLDYLLPEMSGEVVFENLQRLNPGVRVLLVTGCPESVATKMFENGLHGYIQKPFDLSAIVQRVQDAINAPAVGSVPSPA